MEENKLAFTCFCLFFWSSFSAIFYGYKNVKEKPLKLPESLLRRKKGKTGTRNRNPNGSLF